MVALMSRRASGQQFTNSLEKLIRFFDITKCGIQAAEAAKTIPTNGVFVKAETNAKVNNALPIVQSQYCLTVKLTRACESQICFWLGFTVLVSTGVSFLYCQQKSRSYQDNRRYKGARKKQK
jgi:hypothetical protein